MRSGVPEVVTRSALRLADEEDAEEFCSRRHTLASLDRSVDYFNCTRCLEIVVESGRFPGDDGTDPQMTEPSRGYHGVRFFETFGDFGFTMKARMETRLPSDFDIFSPSMRTIA